MDKARFALLFATLFVAWLFGRFLVSGTLEPCVDNLLIAAGCGLGGCALYRGCRAKPEDPDEE